MSFICSANNNIARISQNVESLASTFGNRIDIGVRVDGRFRLRLRCLQRANRRSETCVSAIRRSTSQGTADHVVEGKVDLFALREEAYGPALDAVTGLPGVADKIGNCVLLFSLDKLEAFPVDVHIERAVEREYAPRFDGKP